MFSNVFVGVDGRPGGRDAIALAKQLTEPGGQITLARVHEVAEPNKADLPVIGSGHRGLLGRVLLGDETSASQAVGAPS